VTATEGSQTKTGIQQKERSEKQMTQTDALAAGTIMAGQATAGISGVNMTFTPEQVQELLTALSEPFDREVVEWRVTTRAASAVKSWPTRINVRTPTG